MNDTPENGSERRPDRRLDRPGDAGAEHQDNRPAQPDLAIDGPGAGDFLTAPSGLDTPESGTKGMAGTRDSGPLADARRLTPRPGPDTEAFPGERDAADGGDHAAGGRPDDRITGSQTGTIGGGGPDAHNPSPVRARGLDEPDTGAGGAPKTK